MKELILKAQFGDDPLPQSPVDTDQNTEELSKVF